MKKLYLFGVLTFVISLSFACSSGPSVTAVSITAPWDSMNLPVKEKARVWGSTPTELKVVHQDDKPIVLAAYQSALMSNGWKPISAKPEATSATVDFQKDGKALELYIYDFEKTGVILKMK